jgi:lipopolysaccharide export system protein LptA
MLSVVQLRAQSPADTTERVEILDANKLLFKKVNDNTELRILSGKVRLKQGNTIFTCDSCVMNESANIFEAFGNVHINDNDTAHVYSNYLRYLTDKKLAYLTGKVRMTDGHATLTTNDLEYDVANKIGIYKNGGRVVNKKSVLTSKDGIYYSDLKDIYFKNNVELKDPAYFLKTDSLLYNTESQIARFIAETFIRDSTNRTIRTREGFYDVANRKAEFTSRTEIRDGALYATGDEIANDDARGIIQMRGQAVMIDTAQGISILAGEIFINKNSDAFLATRKPLMIIKQDADSIYVTADTLFSARLTDLYGKKDSLLENDSLKRDTLIKKDTLKGTTVMNVKKDSTNRYFEAFRNVRVFSDSVQAVSDSLFYSFRDSTFHLFYDPVVWSKKNQITGDTIYLYTRNKKADRIRVIENSFLVNELDPGVYNQIKSSRMDGFFKEGSIDSVRAKGFAESIYFIQDDDSAYSGINQTKSDAIDIYFIKGELYKVVLRSGVKGTLTPISQKTPSAAKLEKFRWLINRRPKTKYELFE